MDKIEAEGEGTDDEKKMHRDGTEAEKSLDEISKGAQLEDTIHNQITLEHVDPDATATARAPQDESPQDAPPLSPQATAPPQDASPQPQAASQLANDEQLPPNTSPGSRSDPALEHASLLGKGCPTLSIVLFFLT